MYNVFIFDKQRKLSERNLKQGIMMEEIKKKRAKSKKILARNYEKRYLEFKKNRPYELFEKPQKCVKNSKSFITNYSSTKERISTAVSNAQWLDTTPSLNSKYDLRKRDKSKELSSDLRYRPSTSKERVLQVTEWQKTFLETSESLKKISTRGKTVLNYYHPKLFKNSLNI